MHHLPDKILYVLRGRPLSTLGVGGASSRYHYSGGDGLVHGECGDDHVASDGD
jgi:hypothetical protein